MRAAWVGTRSLLVVSLVGTVLGALGTAGGARLGDVTAGLLLRGLVVLAGVLLTTRLLAGAVAESSSEWRLTAVAATAAYVAVPWAWMGRAVSAQLLAGPGALAMAGDLVLWCGAVGLGAFWGRRGRRQPLEGTAPAAYA